MTSLVIVHQGAIGDFIVSLPVIEALHRAFPETLFTFLANPRTLELIRSRPFMGSVLDCRSSRWVPLYVTGGAASSASLPTSHPVTEIFVFGRSSSQTLADNLAAMLAVPARRIDPFPDPGLGLTVTEYQCRQLEALGIPALPPPPAVIAPAVEDADEAAALVARGVEAGDLLVFIHPGSGGRKKLWTPTGWVALMGRLLEQPRVRVGVIEGPADGEIARWIRERLQSSRALFFDNLRLGVLAGVLGRGALYLGNDSGITHLAAACGIPTIALFGPTDPRLWAPRGPCVRIVRWQTGSAKEGPDRKPGAEFELIWEQVQSWLYSGPRDLLRWREKSFMNR
ncbi:MAG TPA: glycosyltransferase family 9 protein [Syntrophobacteria bacterium]|nr:glycosyltransferase family 9 protein [Syntrophobacteria bacterium]